MLFGHVIADRPEFMGMLTDQFLRQVKFLKKHYKIASLPEAIEMLREGRVPAPTVVLTFDDGYEDNHLGLRAVIDSEELPVTLFVCTKNVEEHRPFGHDLKRGEAGFSPLTWDQLKDFECQGSTIGSHTRTHFDCGATDESVLRSEIVGLERIFAVIWVTMYRISHFLGGIPRICPRLPSRLPPRLIPIYSPRMGGSTKFGTVPPWYSIAFPGRKACSSLSFRCKGSSISAGTRWFARRRLPRDLVRQTTVFHWKLRFRRPGTVRLEIRG